jgi:hypothetical protein
MNKFIFFLLLVSIKVNAQGLKNISGFVGAQSEKTALPYVTVSVLNTQTATYSNEKGFFSISCKDSDTIHFSSIGYETINIPVLSIIKKDSVFLNQSNITLNEIVITNDIPEKKRKSEWVGFYKKNKQGGFLGIRQAGTWIYNPYLSYLDVLRVRCLISPKPAYYHTLNDKVERKGLKKERMLVRLRIYLDIINNIPVESDILNENILLEVDKKQSELIFDLSNYNIKIPPKGFFVCLEFLGILRDGNLIPYNTLSNEEICQFNVKFTYPSEGNSYIKSWNKNEWSPIGKKDFRFSVELEVPQK